MIHNVFPRQASSFFVLCNDTTLLFAAPPRRPGCSALFRTLHRLEERSRYFILPQAAPSENFGLADGPLNFGGRT